MANVLAIILQMTENLRHLFDEISQTMKVSGWGIENRVIKRVVINRNFHRKTITWFYFIRLFKSKQTWCQLLGDRAISSYIGITKRFSFLSERMRVTAILTKHLHRFKKKCAHWFFGAKSWPSSLMNHAL